MHILTPDDLRAFDSAALDALVRRHDLVLAAGCGELRGHALAAALHSDWLAISSDSTLVLDSAAAWSGAFWRIGPRAARLLLVTGTTLTAHDAFGSGLCDAVVAAGTDPVESLEAWVGSRSTLALASAAALFRSRGGDALERAEFARLFAIGEPQRGLAAFLRKARPVWNCNPGERSNEPKRD